MTVETFRNGAAETAEAEPVDFNAPRVPMSLAHDPGLGATARGAIEARLGGGCHCGSGAARLTIRRTMRGVDTVALQCLRCGSAVGGAIKREDHPDRDTYPAWDEPLREDYYHRRRNLAVAALDARRADVDAMRALARHNADEYAQWLRASPDWKELRRRVMERARRQCEACLVAPATQVHHETYALGRLPPAWHLRAICDRCHGRLHSGADEWTGAERGA